MAAKAKRAASSESLLVEILTEELPPKSLSTLSQFFADAVFSGLVRHQLQVRDIAGRKVFATPRRLATLIPKVLLVANDRSTEIQGPPVKASPEAVAGFARKQGVAVAALEKVQTGKGEFYLARVTLKGVTLESVLAAIVSEALKKLPIPKMMRWGDGDAQFVRPVHGLVMLHGKRIVPGKVLGIDSANRTRGHRFLGTSQIVLGAAEEYEAKLAKDGKVIAGFADRRSEIERQLKAQAARQKGVLGDYAGLLDEVTALVEYPSVYVGMFDQAFLAVPQECLILTMRQNQKYFPLFDSGENLLPRFLIVSNMKVADPSQIIGGNERVIRPRFEDARFFYDQDRKVRLEARVPALANVVYHSKLGTQLERTQRIQLLAGKIARSLNADPIPAERAAWLSKADLVTGMVGEFPELQGVMGRHYALHDGEPREVADAIEAHYRPRFAGDKLPETSLACAVALADKLYTLAGLFGIGQQPSGEKDPFGLRRSALGVIRILVERHHPLSLHDLINAAFATFGQKVGDAHTDLQIFVHQRFASYLRDLGYSALQIEAVLSTNPVQLSLVPKQLEAVKLFQALPEAESLIAANKRVANILKQAAAKGESFANAESHEMKDPADAELLNALRSASSKAKPLFEQGDYTGYLKTFSVLKAPVDKFFESVMVMAEDRAARRGRLALLADLRREMNLVADISKLTL